MKTQLTLLSLLAIATSYAQGFLEKKNPEAFKTVAEFQKCELWLNDTTTPVLTRKEFAERLAASIKAMPSALKERLAVARDLKLEFATPNEISFDRLDKLVGNFTAEFKALSLSPADIKSMALESRISAAQVRYVEAAASQIKPFLNTNENEWARMAAITLNKLQLTAPHASQLFGWFGAGSGPEESKRSEWAVFVDSSIRTLDKSISARIEQGDKGFLPASLFGSLRKLCVEFSNELRSVGAVPGELEIKLARAEKLASQRGSLAK